MKKLKRVLATLISTVVLLSTFTTSFALNSSKETLETAEQLISCAIKDPDTPFSSGNYTLGESIPVYYLENQTLEKYDSTEYYPVYCDDIPVGIFSINGKNTKNPTYSFGEDFIDYLNIENNNYFLVITENQIFSVNDQNANEVISYDMSLMDVTELTTKNAAFCNSTNENEVQLEEKIIEDYEPDHTNAKHVFDIASKYDIINNIGNRNEKTDLAVFRPITTRSFTQVPGKIPKVKQESGSNYCWAISSWCVGEIKTDYGYEYTDCIDYAGGKWGKGGTSEMQKKILKGIYDQPNPTLYYPLSERSTKTLINRGDPFIMICCKDKDDSLLGHSVTCYAYDDYYSPLKLAVMDSNTGTVRWMTTSGSDYQISYAGVTFTYMYALSPTKL